MYMDGVEFNFTLFEKVIWLVNFKDLLIKNQSPRTTKQTKIFSLYLSCLFFGCPIPPSILAQSVYTHLFYHVGYGAYQRCKRSIKMNEMSLGIHD